MKSLGPKSITNSLVTLLLCVIGCACNGNENSDNSAPTESSNTNLTSVQSQLTALQSQVNKLQESVSALQTRNSTLETQLGGDETKLNKIALLGHQPSTNSSYGPCSDMGMLVGSNQVESLTATTEYFRQCSGYEYGAVVESGAIAKPSELWFDGANCTGNIYEAENDGGYNRQVLQNGVVFVSPIDGITELMVASGQTAQRTTLQSNFSGGTCNTAMEIQNAYPVTLNNLSITGVPSAVPANFTL